MKRILVLFSLLVCVVGVFGQQYNFINYSIEEGLAQSQVRSICQDERGYIWIGTLGGLSKFDGVNFENFSTNDGLLNNQINAIYCDSKGNIWLGTNGGVSLYNGYTFENFPFKEELAENSVLSITEDRLGNIWFATDGGGVLYYNKNDFNYITMPNGAKNNYVRSIVPDKKGNVWLATRNGVARIDEDFNIHDVKTEVNATQLIVENDEIWCSTFGKGVLQIQQDTCISYSLEQGLISSHFRGIVKRKNGSYWFVSKLGVSKLMNGLITNFTTKDGLKDQNIKCAFEDIDGNLFLGTDGGGLIKFTNDDFVSYTEEDAIGSNVVMSILEDHNRNIWLSTYGEGVGVFTSKGYELLTDKDGLGNNTVWCSMVSRDSNLWVGTSNGVSVFDGTSFTTYNKKDGLDAKKVYSLAEDAKKNIWIGTKEGVSVLNKSNGTIKNLGIGRNIRRIFIESENYIWFCSSEGLFKYNVQTENFKVYTEKDGLPSESTMNIILDTDHKYWVGTMNGLAILKEDEVIPVEIPGNYASNNINFLQLDKYNNLWIGTNYGLYKLDISEGLRFTETDFTRYSNLDGLKSLECNQNASFIDSKDNLWFGTSYGLMKHQVKKTTVSAAMPKVQLKDIRLFYEYTDFGEFSTGLIGRTKLPSNLVLTYNKNHLTFDFVGIFHANPDKVKYRFKLDGFDEDWQPVTTANSVTYSNIPSGEFTFKLISSTDLKNWSKPVEFSFKITPPFWLTWWFFALTIFVISGIVYLIVERRKRVKLAKRATQLLVDKSKMLALEQQALNASMNRHFIFNALNSIQFYINRQDKIAANKYLSSFAKLVRKNLDSSLVNEIYLDDEIERINLYLKLEQMRFQDKFSYMVNVDEAIEPQSIKIPSMLLQPFIENSIWHGILPSNEHGNITVDIKLKENKLIIKVLDDGIGIDVSIDQKKDKAQHHDSKGMELTKGRIKLISKISNKDCAIKGPYQVYNENNEVAGTEVSIILTL